jgi:hypothetical protein
VPALCGDAMAIGTLGKVGTERAGLLILAIPDGFEARRHTISAQILGIPCAAKRGRRWSISDEMWRWCATFAFPNLQLRLLLPGRGRLGARNGIRPRGRMRSASLFARLGP